ncbi:nuclear transport factor 2 family protein [Aquimarina sp. M1]
MLKTILVKTSISFFIIFMPFTLLKAQSKRSLKKTILELDNKFWESYNSCDINTFKTFFVEDFEFYHDKGGLTAGLDNMISSVKNELCKPENPSVRREVVEGSVEVFPLTNYGAIITGEHVFYVSEKGKEERLAEIAKFTHVWQHKDNQWKMTRVLSYDHQPAPQNTDKKEITLSDEILNQYTGTYQAPQTGTVVITKKDQLLEINAGKMQVIVYPQTETLFFHKQSPLTFEFIKNSKGDISRIIVRENGQIAEEAQKIK